MNKSAMIGELVKAIAEAQTEYKALVATHSASIPGKDGKSGYQYSYADLNDGLDALQNTLNSRGVAVVQEAYSVERGIEVVTTLALGEQWMESRPLFMPVSGGAQAVGSAITYGRRYSLFPMVGLAPADDDGEEANRNAPAPSKQPAKPRTPKAPTSVPDDGLGARCGGKAGGIAESIDRRMHALAKLRKGKLAAVWSDVLDEAGVDRAKYGEGALPPAALTVGDGTAVRDYLVRVMPGDDDGQEGPREDAPLTNPKDDCARLWVRLRQLDPDVFKDENWKLAWASFAGIPAWPERPTHQQHLAAADGMRSTVQEYAAP